MRKIALMSLCLIILSFAPTSVTAQNSGQHFWQSIDKIGNYELAVIEQASGKSAQKFIDTSIAFKVLGSTVSLLSHDGVLWVFNYGFEKNLTDHSSYKTQNRDLSEIDLKEVEVMMMAVRENLLAEVWSNQTWFETTPEDLAKADWLAEEICKTIALLPVGAFEPYKHKIVDALTWLARRGGNRYFDLWEPLVSKFVSNFGLDALSEFTHTYSELLLGDLARAENRLSLHDIKGTISSLLQKLNTMGADSTYYLIADELVEKIKAVDPVYADFLDSLPKG